MTTISVARRAKHSPIWKVISFVVVSAVLQSPAIAQKPINIPMTADRWETKNNVEFSQADAYPLGVTKVNKGDAVLKGFEFHNGTIEFDVIPTGSMGGGIGFRRKDDDTFEDFYLRPRPNCATAVDCMQYAPQTHGVLLWDVFPQYQGPAPLKPDTWNHIKLVVSGRRMNIFVNGASAPTLAIGRLEGDVLEGGLLLQGPATFANLTVIPDAVEGLTPVPVNDPTDGEAIPARLADFVIGFPSPGQGPGTCRYAGRFAALDTPECGARRVSEPEPPGWIAYRARSPFCGMAENEYRFRLKSDQACFDWMGARDLGFRERKAGVCRQESISASGRAKNSGRTVVAGEWVVRSTAAEGENGIAIALADNFYGWGLELRLDDLKGVRIAKHKAVLAAEK